VLLIRAAVFPYRIACIDHLSLPAKRHIHMPLRILIADDSDRLRAGIRQLLRSHAEEWIVCGEAADGEQALTQVNQLKPDVILLDLSIPRLSGVEVARSLRQILPSITVVIMSQQEPKVLRQIAESLDVTYCVPKSTIATDLISHLRNISACHSGPKQIF
jgi:DNA-binding NarL/FixJ family response regulator